jgi:chemotaxis protein histidine kinase CheA
LTARPTGGEGSTGLGLSIVKRLAEVMSGTVQCHSVLGAGATFSLRLPKCPKDEIPKISVANSEAQPTCIPFPTIEQRASIRASS